MQHSELYSRIRVCWSLDKRGWRDLCANLNSCWSGYLHLSGLAIEPQISYLTNTIGISITHVRTIQNIYTLIERNQGRLYHIGEIGNRLHWENSFVKSTKIFCWYLCNKILFFWQQNILLYQSNFGYLRGEIPLEPLKKVVFFNFILGEWKQSKSGFYAYIRRHYLT